MKIYLVAPDDDELLREWEIATRGIAGVTVVKGDPLRQSATAIVCPGDTFGLMTRTDTLNWTDILTIRWSHVLGSVRHGVGSPPHCGELALGHAVMVPTGTNDIQWLIYAPDRCGFEALGAAPTGFEAYRSTRAALSLVRRSGAVVPRTGKTCRELIESIVLVPMARGAGVRGAIRCAKQMAFAIRNMDTDKPRPESRAAVGDWRDSMGMRDEAWR